MLQQDAILQALVLLREEQLVAYVRSSEPIEPVQLRSQLSQQLPAYMLPHFFVQLEQFPLTPNGKLDRLALPPPDRAALQAQYIAPRTPTEEKIATIWTQLLGIDHISIQSNFFRLGGHSLLATQLAARINEAFQIDVSLRAFFEAPTIESQAVLVEQNAASSQVPQGPILRPLDRRPSRDRS
nr:phosphopantetheine-binding protein [Ktedonosporobacter rubrisoli]